MGISRQQETPCLHPWFGAILPQENFDIYNLWDCFCWLHIVKRTDKTNLYFWWHRCRMVVLQSGRDKITVIAYFPQNLAQRDMHETLSWVNRSHSCTCRLITVYILQHNYLGPSKSYFSFWSPIHMLLAISRFSASSVVYIPHEWNDA